MDFANGRNLCERLERLGLSRESDAPLMRREEAGKEETEESGKEETGKGEPRGALGTGLRVPGRLIS